MKLSRINKFNKFIDISFIISFMILIPAMTYFIYASNIHKLTYIKPNQDIFIDYKEVTSDKDKLSIRKELNQLADINFYIYKDADINNDLILGQTIIPIRLIKINNKINIKDYPLVLAHELMHLKYICFNERYVQFKAFQLLYESNDIYYKQLALNYAYLDINKQTTSPEDYYCGYYIEQYLKEIE